MMSVSTYTQSGKLDVERVSSLPKATKLIHNDVSVRICVFHLQSQHCVWYTALTQGKRLELKVLAHSSQGVQQILGMSGGDQHRISSLSLSLSLSLFLALSLPPPHAPVSHLKTKRKKKKAKRSLGNQHHLCPSHVSPPPHCKTQSFI